MNEVIHRNLKMALCVARTLLACSKFPLRKLHTQGYPLQFQTSPILSSDPAKKKKHIDPNAIKKKEEKRLRRLEKGIRRLERAERVLKPVEELSPSSNLLKEKELRQRLDVDISPEELVYREKLKRRWSEFKRIQFMQDAKLISRLVASQKKALSALREESEELYQAAIQVDPFIEGFEMTGPVFTPPIPEYSAPDGEYVTVAQKFNLYGK